MRPDSKFFYEMLILTYTGRKELFEELNIIFKQMLSNNETQMWDDFEKNIDMLIEEISCFLEIGDDMQAIENAWEKNKQNQQTLNQKMNELQNSSALTVGFFNKKPKSEKIQEYKAEIKETEELDFALGLLLKILAQHIINTEIEYIKERKKVRYDDAVKTFSQRRIKSLEDCLQFWTNVTENIDGTDILQSQLGGHQL